MVCRQLGYNGTVRASTNAEFGQGNGTIWMANVRCAGSESSLNQCPFNGWGNNNCVHGEDAGVVCQGRELNMCVYVYLLHAYVLSCSCIYSALNLRNSIIMCLIDLNKRDHNLEYV